MILMIGFLRSTSADSWHHLYFHCGDSLLLNLPNEGLLEGFCSTSVCGRHKMLRLSRSRALLRLFVVLTLLLPSSVAQTSYIVTTGAILTSPIAVSRDSNGYLYVTSGQCLIIKFDSLFHSITLYGTVSSCTTSGSTTAATYNSPKHVYVDSDGNIYVTEHETYIVRKISTTGIVSVYAGTVGSSSGGGDGSAATAASLYRKPFCIAGDTDGNIYITDAYRIRRVTVAGIINTVAGTGNPATSGNAGPATSIDLRILEAYGCHRRQHYILWKVMQLNH